VVCVQNSYNVASRRADALARAHGATPAQIQLADEELASLESLHHSSQ
jgi:hypothetical protein